VQRLLSILREDDALQLKLDRVSALEQPFSSSQVDRLQFLLHEVLYNPDEFPEQVELGFKAWTMLTVRLILTIRDLRAQIARAKQALEQTPRVGKVD